MRTNRTEAIAVSQTPPFHPQGRPLAGLSVTLDPGHGGHSHADGYAGSVRGVRSQISEEHLNLLVASQLAQYLIEAGAQVFLTRHGDEKVVPGDSGRDEELGARTAKAEQNASHLFLSIHHNWSERPSAHGVLILIRPEPSALELAIADILRDEVERQVPHGERFEHWRHDHPLVSGCPMPSAVVEFGFLSNEAFDAWVSQQGAHRSEALGLYNAIVRIWQTHREELEAHRARCFPSAPPVPSPPEGIPYLAAMASRLWPMDRPPSNEKELNWVLQAYRTQVINDRREFWVDVRAYADGGSWMLSGSTNVSQVREALGLILGALGVEGIDNQVRLLPDRSKLGNQLFGICQIPLAFTWGEPREGVDVQSQLLLGERLHLLDESDDGQFLLAHGQDGYAAWVRSDAVLRLNLEEFGGWVHAERALVVRELMVDDLRLPMGAALPIIGVQADGVALRLPRGYRATDGVNEVFADPESVLELPKNAAPGRMAVDNALELLTTPYVFGGRGSLGIDCSGMTGVAYQALGDALARDARQQVMAGQLAATPWHLEDLKPGDLMFFLDQLGRVAHTGLSIGGYRYIHSSSPEVQISSLDPEDELYLENNAKRFCFAKRPYLD